MRYKYMDILIWNRIRSTTCLFSYRHLPKKTFLWKPLTRMLKYSNILDMVMCGYTEKDTRSTRHIRNTYRTGHIQDGESTGRDTYRTGDLQDRTHTGRGIYRTGHLQDRTPTGRETYRTGQLQDGTPSGRDTYRTLQDQTWLLLAGRDSYWTSHL